MEFATRGEHPQRGEFRDDGTVPTSGIGLSLERAQLPTDLAQQILQPGEVALGGGEPALGLLLAAAVLQDAGSLLDDSSAVLGPGVEHGIDLTLRDDDVLLATHAGIGQQILDVEETTGCAVDGVLAVTVAEQRARDRHFGELDREHARGVVDGEADLGASQSGAL